MATLDERDALADIGLIGIKSISLKASLKHENRLVALTSFVALCGAQAWKFTMKSVSFFLFMIITSVSLGLLGLKPISTDIKAEFFREAPEAWALLRNQRLENLQEKIEIRREISESGTEEKFVLTKRTVAYGNIFFAESISDQRSKVAVVNKKYGFLIRNNEAGWAIDEWALKGERDANYFEISLSPDLLSQTSTDTMKQMLTNQIGRTEALALNSGNPVELLIGPNPLFELGKFKQTSSEFGRLVSASLIGSEGSVVGEISFLADHNWVVSHFLRRKNGKTMSSLENTYQIDSGKLLLVSSKRFENYKTFSISDESRVSMLTESEVSDCVSKSYFSKYGLPEPEFRSFRWHWIVGGFGLAICIMVGLRKQSKKAN